MYTWLQVAQVRKERRGGCVYVFPSLRKYLFIFRYTVLRISFVTPRYLSTIKRWGLRLHQRAHISHTNISPIHVLIPEATRVLAPCFPRAWVLFIDDWNRLLSWGQWDACAGATTSNARHAHHIHFRAKNCARVQPENDFSGLNER